MRPMNGADASGIGKMIDGESVIATTRSVTRTVMITTVIGLTTFPPGCRKRGGPMVG